MTVSPALVTVHIPNFDGVSKDQCQQSWVVMQDNTDEASQPRWNVRLEAFYNALTPYLSGHADWAHARFDWYLLAGHMDGSAHGSPNASYNIALTAPSATTGLPAGVAACLSYWSAGKDADAVTGPTGTIPTDARAVHEGAPATHSGHTRPQSRDRGRLYVGPLGPAALEDGTGTTGETRISASLRSTLAAAAEALITSATGAAVNEIWSQWSRRNNMVSPVTGGRVGNAFSYQRKREIAPSLMVGWGTP
jgi:hypothetical protein